MKELSEKIKASMSLLPDKPGVYEMKDASGKIIYIGKAKNLKKRVSQYFLRPQVGKVAAMVSHVDDFEFIILNSDKEAFILEMNLIQTHYPRYNIMLMDDSHYPYIAVNKKDGQLKISRDARDKRFYYFGPFPNSGQAYKTIDLLNSLYPTRKCKNLGKKSCLYYELGQCLAPCVKEIPIEVTSSLYEKIKRFLDGDIEEAKKMLEDKIEKASEEERYEDAKYYYDILLAVKATVSKQSVEHNADKTSRDVIGFSTRDSYLSIAILTYRRGVLLGKKTVVVPSFLEPSEQVPELLEEYYSSHELPKEIAINLPSIDEEFFELFPEVNIVHPKEGRLHEQIDLATLNAREGLDAHFASARLDDDKVALLEELGKLLSIAPPMRIELFDNSHLEGSNAVGAEVCYINGSPCKKMYRKYHLSAENAGDDYHSMEEVVYRRYKRLKDEDLSMPDLLLVDGGYSQVKAASSALEKAEVKIPLFGLYKNDKHQTEGIIDINEKLYPLDNRSPLFFLLMRMQDEVHRFAISFHKSVRSKAMSKSLFDDIEGIGERRKELLRKHYPTLESLEKASVEELMQLLPEKVARNLYMRIKEGDKKDD